MFILDESKSLCKGPHTGIYVGDKFMPVGEDGCVKVPFEKTNKTYDCILMHENFAMKASYSVNMEKFSLAGALIFNEESFISGRMAKIIVRLRLNLNGVPVSLTKIQQARITLNTCTVNDVTNTKVFEDLKLANDTDPCFEFLVPNGLNFVNVTFEGHVESVNNPKVNLSFSDNFLIDKRQNTDLFQQPFLIETKNASSGERMFSIELRGRNGEPITEERLSLYLMRASDRNVKTTLVDTDQEGRIEIGALENIESI